MAQRSLVHSPSRIGWIAGTGAFVIWGALPVYWKLLEHVAALEIVCHRVIWSAVFLGIVLQWQGRLSSTARELASIDMVRRLLLSSALLGANWLTFIWAINDERVLESSLGYYMAPLFTVFLGAVFLGERLSFRQKVAMLLAGAGVVIMAMGCERTPWAVFGLTVTWGFYALSHKKQSLRGLPALWLESVLLAPLAALVLSRFIHSGSASIGTISFFTDVLLIATGVATSVPLVLFLRGVSYLPLSAVGVLQYITPTMHLLLGAVVYDEPVEVGQAIALVCIWIAIAIFLSKGVFSRSEGAVTAALPSKLTH